MYRYSRRVIRISLGLTALVFAGMDAASPAAEACSCDARRQVRFLHEGTQALPRNPQLRFRMGRDGVAVPWSMPGQPLPQPDALRFVLIDKQSGSEVAVTDRRVAAGWGLMALVAPKVPLRAAAQYEVVVTQDKQRAKLGEFTTSAVEDHSAPVLDGVASSTYTPPEVKPPDPALCYSGR
ncbi:MAG: hypothetical protein QM813_18765 [Verrucomicrobiota bacterium]